jgi:predicted NBD/HSP70 family sugar kinase
MDIVLGIVIDGKYVRLLKKNAVASSDEPRRYNTVIPIDQIPGYSYLIHDIASAATTLIGNDRLVAVGVGVAGAVREDGHITGSSVVPHVTEPSRPSLLSGLVEAFGDIPIKIINSCSAAALGEYARRGNKRPLTYVNWDVDVTASIVSVVDRHPVVRSIQLGHLIIDRRSKLRCGHECRGCLEAFVGEHRLSSSSHDRDRYQQRWSDKRWREAWAPMATGLHSLALDDEVDTITLGGDVSTQLTPLQLAELQYRLSSLPSTRPAPQLEIADRMTEDLTTGLLGAIYVAQQLLTD